MKIDDIARFETEMKEMIAEQEYGLVIEHINSIQTPRLFRKDKKEYIRGYIDGMEYARQIARAEFNKIIGGK